MLWYRLGIEHYHESGSPQRLFSLVLTEVAMDIHQRREKMCDWMQVRVREGTMVMKMSYLLQIDKAGTFRSITNQTCKQSIATCDDFYPHTSFISPSITKLQYQILQ